MNANAHTKVYTSKEGIPPNWKGFDIGDESIDYFNSIIQNSDTILMNGLLGVFELP